MIRTSSILAILCLISLSSCGDRNKKINNPAIYDFERNGLSTVDFSGQTTRILMATELVNAMKDNSRSIASLQQLFANNDGMGGDVNPFELEDLNLSTKSVKSKIAASRDYFSTNTSASALIKADFDGWITNQVDEVFPFYNQLAEKGIPGQIADGTSVRYINAKGLEYDQAVNKSMIGALMVDQIVNHYLSKSVLDEGMNIPENDEGITIDGKPYTHMEHKWDEAYGYLFGTASNPSDPLILLGEDAFLNKYLARVENDPDFKGIASRIWEAFKLGRAAIVAGDYDTRDNQAEIIRKELSELVGIRSVYYLQQAKRIFENTPQDLGPAFHDLSEAFGFIYSLQFTRRPEGEPYFTSQQVEHILSQLLAEDGFWSLTPQKLDDLSDEIAFVFDFTIEQAAE